MTANLNAIRGGGRFFRETRFRAGGRPTPAEGYAQRIDIYDAILEAGDIDRTELLDALQRRGHRRRNGSDVNEDYCRTELRDLWNRGYIELA